MLFIEDDDNNVTPIKKMLSIRFGLEVDQVSSLKKGLDKFKNDIRKACCDLRYQIVFLDLNAPLENGIKVAKAILKLQNQKNDRNKVPIVAITSNGDT